jgi:hypothetical protein
MRRSLMLAACLMVGAAAAACRVDPVPSRPGDSPAGNGQVGPSAGEAVPEPAADDRAIAFGLLLDSPRPLEVIDAGIEIADLLRHRYGIDSGDPVGDRMEAADRARAELIDRLRFSEEDIEVKARSLGYGLQPGECHEFCDNVRRLAELELQKEALRAFAAGTEGAGS